MVTLSAHPVAEIFPIMRDAEYERLKADIAEHDQQEPILLHQGMIIDGRNRYRACLELGIEPVTREWEGDGSLVELVVSLNLHRRHLDASQLAAIGKEIEEQLAEEAKERQRAAGGDRRSAFAKSGKSDPSDPIHSRREAARIVGVSHSYISHAKTIAKKDPDLYQKVKAGTVKLTGARRIVARREKKAELEAKAAAAAQTAAARPEPAWSIITGDCIAAMADMEPTSVRLIVADPPYNQSVDYGSGAAADRLPREDYIAWCRQWIEAAARLLTSDGSLWLLISDEHAEHIALALGSAGLHRRQWLIWYESFGVNCANMFNRCSRHLFWAVKDRRNFVFHDEAVRRESARQREGDKRADPAGKVWDSVWGIDPPIPRLVENAAERLPDFPTQLPLGLVQPIVGCASDPGDLVLDPFSGSGTTGAACIELGRRFIGIEQSSTFADLSRMRLTAASHVKE